MSRLGLLKLPPPRQLASAVSLSAAWIWIKRGEGEAGLFIANWCCKNVFWVLYLSVSKSSQEMAAELIYVNLGFGSTEQTHLAKKWQSSQLICVCQLHTGDGISNQYIDFLTVCYSDICLTIFINHLSAVKIYPA